MQPTLQLRILEKSRVLCRRTRHREPWRDSTASTMFARLNYGIWLVAIFSLAGCASFNLSKGIPWGEGNGGNIEAPKKLVVFWQDAVLNSSEIKGIRGFGGRLLFYGNNPSKPIKVSGELVVYAFDETNRDPHNVVPDRKFVFTAEQMKSKYSKNKLGHSYSVWIPWDQVGGEQKQISLIARFKSDEGEMVVSEQTKQVLPGASAPEDSSAVSELKQNIRQLQPFNPPGTEPAPLPSVAKQSPSASASSAAVQTVAYQENAAITRAEPQVAQKPAPVSVKANSDVVMLSDPDAGPPKRLTTTTIPVTPSVQSLRMAKQNSQVNAAQENAPSLAVQMGASSMNMPASANLRQQEAGTANPAAANNFNPPATFTAPRYQPGRPPTRFGFERPQAAGAPLSRLEPAGDPWQPRHAEPPYPPASAPGQMNPPN